MSLRVGICITTHNRRAELERTLTAVSALQPPADELHICADGCSDGTLGWLRAMYPAARVIEHPVSRGSVGSRNELASACTCDVFVSLDDDSYPIETHFIAGVRALFEARPRLAVASFPQRSDEFPATLVATDFGAPAFVGSYANSGAAIRRSAFSEVGGYPEFFFHAYEEPDFALRCVCAGWEVRYEATLTVRHHFTNAERSELRTHQRHARNELWSVLLRCPLPQALGVALFRVARQFGYAWKRGLPWVVQEPRWWIAALRGSARCFAERKSLPWARYLAWMQLCRQPITSEAEWKALFDRPA